MTSDDRREPFRATLARTRSAQKGHARGAPAYSVYVNRRIGRVLAALAYRLGWTPDGVTLVSAAHTFAGIAALMLLPASVATGVIVATLLVLGYAWDSADGQLARLRGGGTVAGEWLDHFVDSLKIATLHLAVAVGMYRWLPDDRGPVLLVPLAFSAVATVSFFGMILNDLLKGARGLPSTHSRGGGTATRSLFLLPTDFGAVCLIFVLWGLPPLFLVAYTALLAANTLFLGLAAARWFREMKRADIA